MVMNSFSEIDLHVLVNTIAGKEDKFALGIAGAGGGHNFASGLGANAYKFVKSELSFVYF